MVGSNEHRQRIRQLRPSLLVSYSRVADFTDVPTSETAGVCHLPFKMSWIQAPTAGGERLAFSNLVITSNGS